MAGSLQIEQTVKSLVSASAVAFRGTGSRGLTRACSSLVLRDKCWVQCVPSDSTSQAAAMSSNITTWYIKGQALISLLCPSSGISWAGHPLPRGRCRSRLNPVTMSWAFLCSATDRTQTQQLTPWLHVQCSWRSSRVSRPALIRLY